MRRFVRPRDLRPTLIALAAFSALGAAHAQDKQVEASVTAGVGALSGGSEDRALFGQYNGLRAPRNSVVGLFGLEYWRTLDGGIVTTVRAADLLLDTREIEFTIGRQGDWKVNADYSEIVRREPHTIHTGLLGAGTSTPQVVVLPSGALGSELDLKIKRTALGVGLSKIISSTLQFDASVSSEKKEGARLFGRGFSCPSTAAPGCAPGSAATTGWALLLLPEPINADHTQAEARLSFASGPLRLSAGYYGSYYHNANGTLTPSVPGSLNNGVGTLLPLSAGLQPILSQPISLPPDNQAHHFDVTGRYAFTRTTQLNFKLGYAVAKQDQDFATAGLSGQPAGVTDLSGKMVTTLAQVGITSRPVPKLSLHADIRYRDRDDRTPLAPYNIEGATIYTNHRLPNTQVRTKLQAGYQFTTEYRGLLAVDSESIDRGVFTQSSAIAGITALRQKTDEVGVLAELRRTMTESFSAALGVETRKRTGSNWLRDNSGLGVTEVSDPFDPAVGFSTAIFMPTLADRRRDKAKLYADWQPTERLSLQFMAHTGRDRYDTAPSSYGLRSTRMHLYGVDADFALTDTWRLTGHVSRGEQRLHQAKPAASILSLDNSTTSFGVGVAGKPTAKIELGADVLYIDDKSVYAQTLDATASPEDTTLLAASGGLPDIVFRQTTLRLFGRYEIDKSSAVRLSLVHQRSRWNDWAFGFNGVPFSYADGTTVSQQPNQAVTFVGVTYTYSWR